MKIVPAGYLWHANEGAYNGGKLESPDSGGGIRRRIH